MLLAAIVVALIPALLILTLAILARTRPAQRVTSPGPQFEAARGATVLDDALLLDADRTAPAAVLIDLAVRRKIRLLADEETGARTAIGIEIVEGAAFTPAEAGVLSALFPAGHEPGQVRRFSSDGRRQRRELRAVFSAAEKRLADAGLIVPGRAVWPVVLLRVFGWIGIVVSFVLFVAALAVDDGLGDGPAFAASFLAFLVYIAGVSVVPAPWRRFRRAAQPLRTHLAGLREYIALAEADPLRFSQSVQGAQLRGDVSTDAEAQRLQRFLLNERLLPYAVLFGLEKSWVQTLKLESSELASYADAIEVTVGVLHVIELVGGVAEIASAVGELADSAGNVIEGIGDLLDAL